MSFLSLLLIYLYKFIYNLNRVADKGHLVVGVEGSDLAAKEFFQEQNLEYKMDAINMAPRGALIFSVNIFLSLFRLNMCHFSITRNIM